MTLVQDLQVLHDIDGTGAEDVLRGGVKRLGEDEVRVDSDADDQWIGGEDSLNEVHLTADIVVRGDKGDVLIAAVVNETGRRLIGPRTTTWRGWVCVGMEKGVADVAFVQRSAVCGTEMRRVVRSNCRL
jgi:hypothetical protein